MSAKNNPSLESSVEQNLGIDFKNKKLLHLAFIHRSFVNENEGELETNERLEFLGDAILEFVVSDYLFSRFQTHDEGHLTALRAKLVNTQALASVATKLNLGEVLYLSKGEEKSGGRTNTSLLANTVESLIGAIFLDQGLEVAKKFIEDHILINIHEVVKTSLKDPKSLLQEYVQSQGLPAPVYKTISEVGPDHAKEFTVQVLVNKDPYGTGSGANKQIAAQKAAEVALEKWKSNS